MEFEDRYHQVQTSKYDCLLFDLDDTLYPLNSGIASACLKNIQGYMVEKLGIEETKISELCNVLYKTYGTTMAGLRAIGYHFNYDEYHSFVHGRLPYEKLKPDPVLRNILLSLPFRKVIFTNGDKIHAAKVLNRLGLEDCFEGIICFETLNKPAESLSGGPTEINGDKIHAAKVLNRLGLEDCFEGIICFETLNKPAESLSGGPTEIFNIVEYFSQLDSSGKELPKTPVFCKPSEAAMLHALQIADIDPRRTIFFDDSVRNIQSGKRIGLCTVLVGTSQRMKGADYSVENIHNIREALPELWIDDAEKMEALPGKVGIETPVIA